MQSGMNLSLYASKTCAVFSFQIGINPGLMAAFIGRWFPGPGNHFCKLHDKNYFELCNSKNGSREDFEMFLETHKSV